MKSQLVIFGACEMSWLICQAAKQELNVECLVVANASQMNKSVGSYSSFAAAAATCGFETETVENIEEWPFSKHLPDDSRVLLLSIGAPWFFKKNYLENSLRHLVYNLHGTRLPKDRGGNLFSWLILSGQRTGTCVLHELTEEIDAGSIVEWEEFIYPPACRKPIDYISFYEEKNVAFVLRFLKKWLAGQVSQPHIAQPEYLSSYWPRLRSDVHGWIDWRWSAQEIERFICAFDEPYGGARCRWRNKAVVLRDAFSQAADGFTHPFQHGIVYRNNGKWLSVAAQYGELLICSVTDEEGNNLLPTILPGDRLHTLPADLEEAQKRVIRSKSGGLKVQPYLA